MTGKKRHTPHPDGARKAAWRILLSWESGDDALEAVREKHFRSQTASPRDRALVTELTQGTVRHLNFLDHTIKDHLERPEANLPSPVLTALRLGAYQLIHLHKIPARAAVHETVQIVKDSRYRRFSSLVNAVLRRIAEKGSSAIPSMEESPMRHLELATSTPRWLVERLIASQGPARTREILQALNRIPPITLRVNSARISRDGLLGDLEKLGVDAKPGKLAPDAVIVLDRTPPWDLPPFKEGLCTIQDEGAQLISPLLAPLPGEMILDACAAPGGKTGHLAQLMSDRGHIVAADRVHRRVIMISDTMARLQFSSVRLLTADLDPETSPLGDNVFHGVLLDAPCSGTGVLRRHPEGKWKKDPGTITEMTVSQERLLVSALRTLKRGGRLLYTTCSLLEEENEEVVDRFLSASAGAVRIDMRERFPEMRPDLFTDRGELRLWPHLHDCDGFFACLMEKKG